MIEIEDLTPKKTYKRLVRKLKRKKTPVLVEAIKEIRAHESKSFVRPLMKLLDEDAQGIEDEARVEAIVALGFIGANTPVPEIIKLLNDDNPAIREAAAFALGKMGDNRAVSPLINTLTDKDFNVRENAANALAMLKDPRAIDVLVAMARSEDLEVKLSVIPALSAFSYDEKAVSALIRALEDEDTQVRFPAIISFNKIKNKRAVEPLIKNLENEDPLIQKVASDALVYNLGWGSIKDGQLTKFGEKRRAILAGKEEKVKTPTTDIDPKEIVNEIIDLLGLDDIQGDKLGYYFDNFAKDYEIRKK